MDLIFLGTGGGRWTTITQKLKTGGFRLHGNEKIHVDPGPGALVNSYEYGISPLDTDAIFVTHCHPDHYNDAEILIEAMTRGMTSRRGMLAASESVIIGNDKVGPGISNYHKNFVNYEILKPGGKIRLEEIEVLALPAKHSDPSTVGLSFLMDSKTITYTSDTEFFEELIDIYSGSDIIIFNVMRPGSDRIPWHLCADDVIKILKGIEPKPELAILNHFGLKIISFQDEEAIRVSRETGVKTIAAKDGLRLRINL